MTQPHHPTAQPPRSGDTPSLLVVSDQPDVLSEVEDLAGDDFDVQPANGAGAALQALAAVDFDLLLADHALTPLSGLQVLAWTRQHRPFTAGLLLVAHADAAEAAEPLGRGLMAGCLLRPLRQESLLPALHGAARQSGRERRQAPVLDGLARLRREIEQRQLEQVCLLEQAAECFRRHLAELEEENRRLRRLTLELERHALTDPLTGLFNRHAIEECARQELCRRARYPGPVALGLLDLDHLRKINRRHLHPGGDEALRGVARALSASVRGCDRLGRIGGDEFLVLAPQTDAAGAAVLAERLRAAVGAASASYNNRTIPLAVTLGFAVAEAATAADLDGLRHEAAAALAEAKRTGRNRFAVRTLTGPALRAN
jgi:diguanylate cyclase (GGDEF)-like protein